MPAAFRPVVISIAVAIVSSLVVALVVVSANRQTLIIAAPSASNPSAPAFGVLTTGDATVSKRPDEAFMSAAVESQQSTAAAAQSDLAAKANQLINRIKSLGVADSDVSTLGYWVGPVYAPYDQKITGYRADEQVRIKWHNVDTVGKALDGLVQEGGATRITVSFGLADPKAAQAEARAAAIADARSKAQAMAAAAGVKLAQAVRVSDLASNSRFPGPFDFAGAASPSASTQVPVGQLEVQVTVEVDFAIA